MRRLLEPPKTNIELLKKEVLSGGSKGALPRNLSDGWLRKITRDLLHAQQIHSRGIDDDPTIDLAGPILLVMALMSEGRGQRPISAGELMDELEQYAVALSHEIVARQTGIAPIQGFRYF